jgi:hypothetical protein
VAAGRLHHAPETRPGMSLQRSDRRVRCCGGRGKNSDPRCSPAAAAARPPLSHTPTGGRYLRAEHIGVYWHVAYRAPYQSSAPVTAPNGPAAPELPLASHAPRTPRSPQHRHMRPGRWLGLATRCRFAGVAGSVSSHVLRRRTLLACFWLLRHFAPPNPQQRTFTHHPLTSIPQTTRFLRMITRALLPMREGHSHRRYACPAGVSY